MGIVIETKGLTKRYKSGAGCFNIDLQVPQGCVFGLLGSNGAGKSTLVKTLVGLLRATSGQATVLGKPLGTVAVRKRIGYLPESFRYQPWMTGIELLDFHARLRHVPAEVARRRIPELLEMVNLRGKGDHPIKSYSKGMQQRLGLAAALIADPELVFLDEPTSALDPVGRRQARELIIRLREQGKTIFLNSHLLGEVESVCDQIAVLNSGQLVAMGSLSELRGIQVVLDLRVTGISDTVKSELSKLAMGITQVGDRMTMVVREPGVIPLVAQLITNSGARLYELVPRSRDLEELFFDLVQNGGC